MNYSEFLEKLQLSNFKIVGNSFAFGDFEDWQISFIRLSGRFQQEGKISFVICARPIRAKGVEGKTVKESTNPFDYPFKLTLDEVSKDLKYEPKLLNYSLDHFELNSDWSNVFEAISKTIPEKLKQLGLKGFRKQLQSIKNLGYVEKIWLESDDIRCSDKLL